MQCTTDADCTTASYGCYVRAGLCCRQRNIIGGTNTRHIQANQLDSGTVTGIVVHPPIVPPVSAACAQGMTATGACQTSLDCGPRDECVHGVCCASAYTTATTLAAQSSALVHLPPSRRQNTIDKGQ
jgi:hypothetical protein